MILVVSRKTQAYKKEAVLEANIQNIRRKIKENVRVLEMGMRHCRYIQKQG